MAKEFTQRALELDDEIADAHSTLGQIHVASDWDWTSAEREFRRALELNPASGKIDMQYGWYLVAMGRREDALSEMLTARDLDPFYTDSVGQVLHRMGRYEDAILHLETAFALRPGSLVGRPGLIDSYARVGRNDEALSAIEQHHSLRGDDPQTLAAATTAFESGGLEGYYDWLSEQPRVGTRRRARMSGALERTDETLGFLEQMYREHVPPYDFLGDHHFDFLHDDPRFRDILRGMNLPMPEDVER